MELNKRYIIVRISSVKYADNNAKEKKKGNRNRYIHSLALSGNPKGTPQNRELFFVLTEMYKWQQVSQREKRKGKKNRNKRK